MDPSKRKPNTLISTIKPIPTYVLAALCLLSSIVRIITIYNSRIDLLSSSSSSSPPPQRIDLPSWTYPFILFPASSPYTGSVLTAAGIDIVCGILVLFPRTRFFASGTLLVLQGVGAGGTLQAATIGTGTGAGTSSDGHHHHRRAFEIAAFKLMVANVATLSAWRDSRITSRVVESISGRSSEGTARSARPKVDIVPNSVHQRLRR